MSRKAFIRCLENAIERLLIERYYDEQEITETAVVLMRKELGAPTCLIASALKSMQDRRIPIKFQYKNPEERITKYTIVTYHPETKGNQNVV